MKKVRDFQFKQFTVAQGSATHKVGTDGVLLGAWVNVENVKYILDIGTGTGLIALMLAQRTNDDAVIEAIEIQENDVQQARLNFANSPWRKRLVVHREAVQNFYSDIKFDLIVSNPPYFINSALPPTAERAAVRHTHALSFDELLDAVARLLNPSGKFAVILPYQEGQHFKNLSGLKGLHCIRECEFRARTEKPIERVLMEFSFQQSFKLKEELVLYKKDEVWSDEYKALTREFYLKI
jgi:tRNA1Val (adenine37-N6)-methyltransferase